MTIQTFTIPSLTVALLSLLCLSAPAVLAEGAGREQALTFTFEDEALEWGPCPAFFPEGCGIAVLHGDPAEKNADIFFKVPAGATLPRHWHQSAERMVLVSGELSLTYDGQEEQVMKPGTYAYGPPERPHKGSCAKGGDPCVLFIAFEEPIDAHLVE